MGTLFPEMGKMFLNINQKFIVPPTCRNGEQFFPSIMFLQCKTRLPYIDSNFIVQVQLMGI